MSDSQPVVIPQNPSHERLAHLVEQLRPLTARKRVDLLLDQPDLPAVLERLPVQDLYGLIKEVGVADALELLEAAPPRVLQGFMDLSVWRAERVDPRGLASFYAAMFHANTDNAIEKMLKMDPELRVLFLKLHTRVLDITEDGMPDTEGNDFITTPDNKMVIMFVDAPGMPEEQADPFGMGERSRAMARHAARQLLEALMRHEPAFVAQMMDAIRYELPSQVEDDALRWRNARLMDLGLPPRDEALSVLAYTDPDKTILHQPNPPDLEEDAPDHSLALYASPDTAPTEPFLAAGLRALPEGERVRFARELAVTCNWVAVARNVPSGEPDALRGAVRETRVTVDLALAYKSGGDVTKAGALLRDSAVMDLFRVGHSLGLKLHRQARRLVTPERGKGRVVAGMLDAPLGLALAALLAKQPLYFNGLTTGGDVSTRPFASLEDLASAARALAESAFRLAVGFDVLGLQPARLRKDALVGTNLGDASEVTLEILLTTALARVAAGGALEASPLSATELAKVRAALASAASVEKAGLALAALVAPRAPLPGAPTQDDARKRSTALTAVLLTRLADEMTHVPAGDVLDGRFLARALVLV